MHDALAVAHLIRPDLLSTEHLPVTIDTGSGPGRGQTIVDLLRRTGDQPNAHVALDVDADGFVDLLCERIARLP